MKKQLFYMLGFLMLYIGTQAQTTLISHTGDGGFENGSLLAANGWSVTNAATDGWVVGNTPTVSAGSNCAYISSNGGANWEYSQTSTYVSIYRDITIPIGQPKLTLTFKWKATGEGTSDWDNLKVFFAPTSVTPATSGEVALVNRIGSNFYNLSSATWNTTTITFLGTPGTTQRLIFSWKSDASDIANPPAALDEISLISAAPGNFISITTGNWTNPTTWDANAVPTAVDNVTVSATHSVVINAAAQAVNDLTIHGYLNYSTTPTSFLVNRNTLVSATGTLAVFAGATGKTFVASGDFTNNGIVDLSKTSSLLTVNGSTTQTFGGSGSLVANTIASLTFNNTATAPLINWNWTNNIVSTTLTFTKGWVNLGSTNKLTLGTAIGSAGTLSYTSGGFTSGVFSRWWSNGGTGTSTSASTNPTTATSRYPFVNGTGLNRSAWIERTGPSAGGQYGIKYVDASANSLVSIADGTYTVQHRYDGNWTVSTEGTTPAATSYILVLLAPGSYQAINGNNRIVGASALLGGAHRAGTSTPGVQRTGLTLAELTSGPAYIGAANTDIILPCTGLPSAGTAASSTTLACSSTNFTLSLSGNTTGVSDLTYQWQSSPDNSIWTSIPTATLATSVVSQTATTYYQCIVTCTPSASSATSTAVQVGMNTLLNCYCVTTPGTSNTVDIIERVTLTNSLGGVLTQTSSAVAPNFISYNNTPLDLYLGTTNNTITIKYGTDGTQYGAAWIDFNRNGIYEASENIALATSSAGSSAIVNYTFAVPSGATPGISRIRVRGGADGAYTTDACLASSFGETEDYLINITAVPTCFPPTALTTTNTTTTTTDLSWTAPAMGTPANYVWEVRTSGAAGTGTTGLVSTGTVVVPTNSVSVSGLNPLTSYSVYVQSDCGSGDLSAWSGLRTFTTQANCPVPTALNTTSILATSASFTWTAGGTETEWDVYYNTQPLTAPSASTIPTATTSVASYSATGLTATTPYSIYVRANCGAGSTSIWTAVKNFTTPVSCPAPSIVTVSGTTPTSAVATWTAGSNETSWLVKYSAPTVTTVTGPIPSYTMSGLTPSMEYTVQVKGICAVGDSSVWNVSKTFMTPCLYPNITSTMGSSRCGNGTTTLSATADMGGTLNWYASASAPIALASGSLYTTPTITATTDFYVAAATISSGSKSLGAGSTTGTSAPYNLTNGGYGGLKGQYLITAAELLSAGIAAGNITSLSFELTNAGANLDGFAVEVGTTTLTTFSTANIQGGLTTVYPATTFTPAAGVNTINFVTPFNWNGTSNIIVSTSWSNNNTSNASSTIKYDATTHYSSQTYRKDNETAANMFGFTGSAGTGTSTFDISQNRPKFIFAGNVMCESPRTIVTASINAAPVLSVTTGTTICTNAIQTLSITSTLSDYDVYDWTPVTNLYTDALATTPYAGGNASTLYYKSSVINNTVYSINANNTSNGCANTTSTSMIATMPEIIASATPSALCSGSTVSLTANTTIIAPGSADIGSGNLTSSGSGAAGGSYASPFSHFFGGYKAQYIIRASELQSAGLSAGNMTSLSYSVTTSGTTYTDFAISMAATSQSVANTTFNGSVLTSYGPANVTPTVGLNTYTFASPFNWDGTSNIVVQVCWSNNNGGGSAAEIKYNTTSFPSTSYYRGDDETASTMCGQTTAASAISLRPLLILAGQKSTPGAGTVTWEWNPGAVSSNTTSVTPINNGSITNVESYTVTALDPATTCTNSAVVSFSVSPIPTVTATASSASVCAGSSATLTAGGATNYSWTAGGNTATQVVNPMSASVYTVTGESSGCSNTATVGIGVNTLPSVSATTSSTLVCSNFNESAVLTAVTSVTSYTWSNGANTASTTVTPTVGTTYTLTVNDGTCDASTTVFVDATICTGINNATSMNGISIYPNPTNGILNISIPSELADNTSIEVYDAIGKLVIKETLSTETTTINTTKLTDGIYVFKVINNNQIVKIGKIVKQ